MQRKAIGSCIVSKFAHDCQDLALKSEEREKERATVCLSSRKCGQTVVLYTVLYILYYYIYRSRYIDTVCKNVCTAISYFVKVKEVSIPSNRLIFSS